jgi:copper oxidase (laccase) domain-containing protein
MIIYQPFNHINSKTKVTIYVSEKKDGNFKTYQSIKQYFNNYIPDLAQKRLKYFAHEHQAHRQFSTQKQDYYIADAMITSSDQIVLGMNVADCFPIVYFDPIKFKIALIHGGWKPLFQNILELT